LTAPPGQGTPTEGSTELLTGEREGDELETDRDAFTPATGTAGVGRLIAESAYTYSRNRGGAATHSFPEMIFRYGLTDRVELRLGWNYETGGDGGGVTGADAHEPRRRPESSREHRLAYGV
jgi:hypothetical protein